MIRFRRICVAVCEILEHHRQQRDEHDADRDEREVLLDDRHVAEEHSRAHAQAHPPDRADEVVEDEASTAHLRRAGDKRHERAHDRHEAAEDDGLAAVVLEELVRPLQMLAIEQAMGDARARRSR